MAHSKKVNGPVYDSITKFSWILVNVHSQKTDTGNCCTGSCKNCKNDGDVEIPNLVDEDLVTYNQFEVTKKECLSQKTGTMKVPTQTGEDR